MTEESTQRAPGPLGAVREAAVRAIGRRAETGWPAQAQAERALEAAVAGLLHDAAREPIEQAIEETAFRFRLTPLDLRLLTVAAIAELDPAAHLLLGLLSGDPGPARPTVALAFELAGAPMAAPDARARLGELAPLMRTGLLQLAGTDALPSRRLLVPDRVAIQLAGTADHLPAGVRRLLVDAVPVEAAGIATVGDGLERGERLVWVHAGAGAAGIGLAAGACARLGVDHLCVDLGRVPGSAPPPAEGASELRVGEDLLREVLLEAGLRGAVVVLNGAERAISSVQLLLEAPVPVVAVSELAWDPLWAHELPLSVTATRLTLADRERLWAPLLAPAPVPREITALRMTPEDIARVGRHAVRQAALHGEPVTPALVRRSARRLSQRHHPEGAESETLSLDDLILPEHTAAEVRRMLDWARYRDELLAQAPLQGKGGKGTGICSLFEGGPGTGKTQAAHVVADELGLELMQVDLPSVVSKYIGETEKNLERVFSEAESLNALLFFDEADSLFGSRSEVRDARDRYANQEVSYLLQRMEHFDGITVLATNLRGNVDPAFARRLHFIITFPDPAEVTRKELWAHHLDQLPSSDPDDAADPGALSALDLAGGNIRNVVLSAAYAAIAAGESVGMRHLAAAALREYSKLGRRPPAVGFLAAASGG